MKLMQAFVLVDVLRFVALHKEHILLFSLLKVLLSQSPVT